MQLVNSSSNECHLYNTVCIGPMIHELLSTLYPRGIYLSYKKYMPAKGYLAYRYTNKLVPYTSIEHSNINNIGYSLLPKSNVTPIEVSYPVYKSYKFISNLRADEHFQLSSVKFPN